MIMRMIFMFFGNLLMILYFSWRLILVIFFVWGVELEEVFGEVGEGLGG